MIKDVYMKKLYILNWAFCYNSASSNRLLAYANSMAKMGYPVNIIAMMRLSVPDNIISSGVNITGFYSVKISNKLISFLSSLIFLAKFLIADVKKNDKILLYGSPEYLPLCFIARRNQLFFEITECPDLYPPRTYSFRLYKILWRHLKGIFVISSNLKEYFVSNGVLESRIHVINMVVDPSRFSEYPKIHEKYVTYCGNVVKDSKDGVGDLIKSFVAYHEVFQDRKLLIIGPIKSEDQKNHYIEYLKENKCEDSVIFTGTVSPLTIPEILAKSEMLLLTRPNNIQAKYGFPTKLGEYLLSKRPCVVTNVGNIADFLVHQKNAYIVNPGDINSITLAMKYISANPELANKVGLAGCQVALQYFNSNIESKKLIEIINKN